MKDTILNIVTEYAPVIIMTWLGYIVSAIQKHKIKALTMFKFTSGFVVALVVGITVHRGLNFLGYKNEDFRAVVLVMAGINSGWLIDYMTEIFRKRIEGAFGSRTNDLDDKTLK